MDALALTTADVATLFQVKPRTVERWIADGRLPSQLYGRSRRVKRTDALLALERGIPLKPATKRRANRPKLTVVPQSTGPRQLLPYPEFAEQLS